MQESELPGLIQQVLWASFVLALAFGAIAQRTHFCTMGAVADIVNIGDWSRMRMWVLALGVAMIGFNVMVGLGWIEARHSIYAGPRLLWLSNLLGGLMFGFGMVLASGCASKTLVRVGAGNLKALVVFLVLGLAAYATLRGVVAVLRVNSVDTVSLVLPRGQDLPTLLAPWLGTGAQTQTLALVLGLGLGLALVLFAVLRAEGRSADVLLGGFGIGALVAAAWWVSGRLGHLSEHPLTLEESFLATNSRAMEALSFVAPVAYTLDWLILFSDSSKVLSIGIVSTLGVIAGSGLMALATRKFRWEGFGGVEDTANHLVGAVLMGMGGVMAVGCTIGQGLSGMSTLALGSFIALAAIIAGAVLALRWQIWRLERSL
ncbi:MAG: YeeE/YedE family protein [Rubrivivax sp.]|nr:YeeE/YedE family protein [Rubrivivax sp.]